MLPGKQMIRTILLWPSIGWEENYGLEPFLSPSQSLRSLVECLQSPPKYGSIQSLQPAKFPGSILSLPSLPSAFQCDCLALGQLDIPQCISPSVKATAEGVYFKVHRSRCAPDVQESVPVYCPVSSHVAYMSTSC